MVDKIPRQLLNVLEAKLDTRWTEEHNTCWDSLSKINHRLAQISHISSIISVYFHKSLCLYTEMNFHC